MQSEIEPLTPERKPPSRPSGRQPLHPLRGYPGAAIGAGLRPLPLTLQAGAGESIGLLQGGMIAALADETVAFALYSLVPAGETINTVEMKINFLAAVKEGEVEAVARITKRGRTISLGEVEVRQGERLVAKAMCTYIHLAKK